MIKEWKEEVVGGLTEKLRKTISSFLLCWVVDMKGKGE